MAEVQLTEAGRRELEARLDYLKSVRRAEIAEEIKTARGFGDLSENAAQLRLAKIIHETTVTCCEVKDGVDQEVKTYTIVGTTEADLANGRISDESPVGAALIKSNDGETVSVALPNGRTKYIKVIKVTR